MSVMAEDVPEAGSHEVGNNPGAEAKSAAIRRSVFWSLTVNTNARGGVGFPPAGVAHTFAVSLLEMAAMARGKGIKATNTKQSTLPTFVDVKLDITQREEFKGMRYTPEQLVKSLGALCDDGYRVGCSWSSEHQTYTVSLTCRNEDSVNTGLCMTSFAGDISTAVALAVFKHTVVTEGNWLGQASAGYEDFG